MKHYLFLILLISITLTSTAQSSGSNTDDNGSSYWGGTAVFLAANASINTFNIIRIKKGEKNEKHRSNAVIGIVAGTLQIALGVEGFAFGNNNYTVPASINAGIGAATVVTSILRLVHKTSAKDPKLTYNFFYLPKSENTASVVGLHLVKRFD